MMGGPMKWEYDEYRGDLSRSQLNGLGAQGWELVGYSATVDANDNFARRYYVFKRPILAKNSPTLAPYCERCKAWHERCPFQPASASSEIQEGK